jgi:hypothetical protein
MWEFIDKAVYINLDHREDRRQIMKSFFEEGQIPTEKIERFSAIRHKVGIVGAAISHISVLKRAKEQNWKSVLILEDDIKWVNFEENYKKLEVLVTNPFDVCMIGGTYIKTEPPKIIASFSTTGYIVQSHYYDTLLENFEYSLSEKLDKNKYIPKFPILSSSKKEKIYNKLVDKDNTHNVDVYWIKLQMKDNWIGMIDSMIEPVPSFSDIYNGNVDSSFLNPDPGSIFYGLNLLALFQDQSK